LGLAAFGGQAMVAYIHRIAIEKGNGSTIAPSKTAWPSAKPVNGILAYFVGPLLIVTFGLSRIS
jgi:hypothetical protein